MRRFSPFWVTISFCLFHMAYAEYAVQSDWSGGDGVYGPVVDWGDEFQSCMDIDYYSSDGQLTLVQPCEHLVGEEFNWPYSVFSEDLDCDGDVDILAGAFGGGFYDCQIAWWENTDEAGTVWTKHIIAEGSMFPGPLAVCSGDVSADGLPDVAAVSYTWSLVAWWKNLGGPVPDWEYMLVSDTFSVPEFVKILDFDLDGDMDLLVAFYGSGRLIWWENSDGSGTDWTLHHIDTDFFRATCADGRDIDGDGDVDVAATSYDWDTGDSYVVWYRNEDGSGTEWSQHFLNYDFEGAWMVVIEDIDCDGDQDVTAAAMIADEVLWWENLDGAGGDWTEHTIDDYASGACGLRCLDMDGDGDCDVVAAAEYASDITLYENLDGAGVFWDKHTVRDDFGGASAVHADDVNGDGNPDVIGCAKLDDQVAWWDLSSYCPVGGLVSSVLDTEGVGEWGDMSWSAETPAGTEVCFQVRASVDHTSMGPWSDTLYAAVSLDSILSPARYFQYRTMLQSEVPESTPVLEEVSVSWDPLGASGEETGHFPALLPLRPNPAALHTARVDLPFPATVSLAVFDVAGRLVRRTPPLDLPKGTHGIGIEGLSSGVYFCRMTSEYPVCVRRFTVIE